MKPRTDVDADRHAEAEERRNREAALDRTIEASFPASDPPSTNPNPDAHDGVEHVGVEDGDTDSEG
jgi:hypothetical protein